MKTDKMSFMVRNTSKIIEKNLLGLLNSFEMGPSRYFPNFNEGSQKNEGVQRDTFKVSNDVLLSVLISLKTFIK